MHVIFSLTIRRTVKDRRKYKPLGFELKDALIVLKAQVKGVCLFFSLYLDLE